MKQIADHPSGLSTAGRNRMEALERRARRDRIQESMPGTYAYQYVLDKLRSDVLQVENTALGEFEVRELADQQIDSKDNEDN